MAFQAVLDEDRANLGFEELLAIIGRKRVREKESHACEQVNRSVPQEGTLSLTMRIGKSMSRSMTHRYETSGER